MPMRENACFSPLLADPDVRSLFDTQATLDGMLAFEQALTQSLVDCAVVDARAAELALTAMATFQPDMVLIAAAVERDGLPVPEWARQLKTHAGPAALPAIHIGATSQDLLDTSLSIGLKALNDLLDERLGGVVASLDRAAENFGKRPMMGRTRMQAALPVTVADRVDLWRRPLIAHQARLADLRPQVEVVQFAGPVGLRDVPATSADEVMARMAGLLGLWPSTVSWHANRERLVDYGYFLSLLTGSLGKMGQDIALMSQQGVDEVVLAGGGISSAMPHKQNPVLAETLVAFARHNAALAGGLGQAMVHEQERSGTAWTLEWLTLPSMAENSAKSLSLSLRLLSQIEELGQQPEAR